MQSEIHHGGLPLVEKLVQAEGTAAERQAWLQLVAANVPEPRVEWLIFWPEAWGFDSDPRAEEIVDRALSYTPPPRGQPLTRAELVQLVEQIMGGAGTPADVDAWLEVFRRNVPEPDVSGRMYWSTRHG